ncbi:YkvA family protein [Hymenobacter gummosus]|uniref:YkvA family protein n=1 Tax=Hymenobacter gummosus TaxID=1776032 RepID=UPI001A9FDAD4|nr:YkvA family protein [Hymenobacter gummosus]
MATPKSDGERIASSPLFKGFLRKAEDYLKQPLRIKQLLNDAYTKANAKKDIGHIAHEAWESLQTLFRLVKAAASGEYTGVPTPTVLGAVAVLIYFLSPIDLVPDFIPVVGLLDDVALMAWFTSTLKTEMDKFEEWERSKPQVIMASNQRFEPAPESAKRAGTVRHMPSTADAATSAIEQAEHSTSSGSFTATAESAKHAGTADLPGGSSPDPANPAPADPDHHPEAGNVPNPNVTAASTSGSRDPRLSDGRGGDTGGNVR